MQNKKNAFPLSLSCSLKVTLIITSLLFFIGTFHNHVFEKHWDEVSIKDIPCTSFHVPNCIEEDGVSIISDVYVRSKFFEANTSLKVKFKDPNNNNINIVEINVRNKSIKSMSAKNETKIL